MQVGNHQGTPVPTDDDAGLLKSLHEHNIAHLDIAARNILYHAQDSKVSLTDFEGSHFTVERMVRGAYSTTEAPEQVYGEPFDGFAFDVYACGRTLLGQEACRPELVSFIVLIVARLLMNTATVRRHGVGLVSYLGHYG